MRILQLIDSLSTGGAEMMAVNIANALAEKGIASHLCVTRLEGDLKKRIHKDVVYQFLNKKNTFDFIAILKLLKYVQKEKIDIIHAHSNAYFNASLVKVFKPSLKIIWHNHTGQNIHLKGLKFWSLKVFSRMFNGIINVNQDLNSWSQLHFKKVKSIYLANFPTQNVEKITQLKGEKGKRIVLVAGYRVEKDHLNLLQAFKKVNEKHSDWTLHLVGKSYKDIYAQQIDTFIVENKLEVKVYQYGVCSDISHILSQSNIGVLSSYSEGLPVSLLEYGLAGLPVVVTNVGECGSVLEKGRLGKLVPPKNPSYLAKAMQEMIENDKERSNFAQSFQSHVQDNYGQKIFIEKLVNYYQKP